MDRSGIREPRGGNLRIYAERLTGAALGAALGAAGPIEHGVADMLAARALCGPATTLTFVDGATASVHDVLLATTNGAVRHVWDVGRSVTAG